MSRKAVCIEKTERVRIDGRDASQAEGCISSAAMEAARCSTMAAMEAASAAGLQLILDEEGLALKGNGMIVRGDFTAMLPRLRPHNLQRELLVRACKVKASQLQPDAPTSDGRRALNASASDNRQAPRPIRVLDATAGLGEDSLLLAAAGMHVTMYENDPVIAALLRDALRRGQDHPDLAEICSRMTLVEGDSLAAMKAIRSASHRDTASSNTSSENDDSKSGANGNIAGLNAANDGGAAWLDVAAPDVVYLDPMFPERQKSGLIKKKFQLLQRLESPSADEEDMLMAALAVQPLRIVIKRPLKGPPLADVKPGFSLKGKSIRYDCIVPSK